MVNEKTEDEVSTRAGLLMLLREKAGETVSGNQLASVLGISRVAVWKGIQSLCAVGYSVETSDAGYLLDPEKNGDFLYPWEFGEKEAMFRHFESTGSTMDRAREFAARGTAAGTAITAERQSAGRGRNGRTWISRKGGLFCTILDRPALALADYTLPSMALQIAASRVLTSLCGKPALLRWPNDIYVNRRKIAGVMTEVNGEGDFINWVALGIGVNVNNSVLSEKAVSCAGIAGHPFSRREVLLKIMDELDKVKKQFDTSSAYTQGNRLLAAEWNSLADCIGARTAVIVPSQTSQGGEPEKTTQDSKVLAKGIFGGVDPAGRCIIKSETPASQTFYFYPGPASIVYLSS
jgi:BirA family biotin operon repressor/biotin-[acetyl-CoA-carboxylase] ligase